jgi:hypothetical protein
MSEAFTQDLRSQRRNYNDGTTRLGDLGRLWYESSDNTLRVSDGVTLGGIVISGGLGVTAVTELIDIKLDGYVVRTILASSNW